MWGENSAGFYDLTLAFCNTPVGALTETYEDNYGGNPVVKPYYASYRLITTTPDCWVSFELAPSFQFDGTNNLLVEVAWSADEDDAVYNWGYGTDFDSYLAGGYESETGDLAALGLRMKLVGEYGTVAVEPASAGRIKSLYR